jgi:hypothetical protein
MPHPVRSLQIKYQGSDNAHCLVRAAERQYGQWQMGAKLDGIVMKRERPRNGGGGGSNTISFSKKKTLIKSPTLDRTWGSAQVIYPRYWILGSHSSREYEE